MVKRLLLVVDVLAVWLFVKVIRYWRWRAIRGGTRMTILFVPGTVAWAGAEERAEERAEKARFN